MRVNEGTWAIAPRRINTLVKELEALRKKWWNIIGDDIFYDKIDEAIERLRELKKASERSSVTDKKPALEQMFEGSLIRR
jgi:hypothetical protein